MNRAYAADKSGGSLKPIEYEPGPLGPEQVEVAVEHCGICHSDQSMLDNEWGRTNYPFVPGHEIVGRVHEHRAGGQEIGEVLTHDAIVRLGRGRKLRV